MPRRIRHRTAIAISMKSEGHASARDLQLAKLRARLNESNELLRVRADHLFGLHDGWHLAPRNIAAEVR